MNAYRIVLSVIDFEELGEEGVKRAIESMRFPNDCINPHVQAINCADIGDWHDGHPLNKASTAKAEFARLFAELEARTPAATIDTPEFQKRFAYMLREEYAELVAHIDSRTPAAPVVAWQDPVSGQCWPAREGVAQLPGTIALVAGSPGAPVVAEGMHPNKERADAMDAFEIIERLRLDASGGMACDVFVLDRAAGLLEQAAHPVAGSPVKSIARDAAQLANLILVDPDGGSMVISSELKHETDGAMRFEVTNPTTGRRFGVYLGLAELRTVAGSPAEAEYHDGLNVEEVLRAKRKARAAEPMPASEAPYSWREAVERAAANAKHVFSDSCDHTKQAIDYMKVMMDTQGPAGDYRTGASVPASEAAIKKAIYALTNHCESDPQCLLAIKALEKQFGGAA